jgi:hypothetical protein
VGRQLQPCRQSYPRVHEPCLAPPTFPTRREDVGHALAPPPISPPAPPCPFPTGGEESHVNLASGQGR